MSWFESFTAEQVAEHQQLMEIVHGHYFMGMMSYLCIFGGYALAGVTVAEFLVVWLLRRSGRSTAESAAKSRLVMWRRMNERYDRMVVAGGLDLLWKRLFRFAAVVVVLVSVSALGFYDRFLTVTLPGIYLLLFGWRTYLGDTHLGQARVVVVFLSFLTVLTSQGILPALVIAGVVYVGSMPMGAGRGGA